MIMKKESHHFRGESGDFLHDRLMGLCDPCFAVVPVHSLWTAAASSIGLPAGGYVAPRATADTSTKIVIMKPDLYSAERAMGLRPALDG